MVNQTYSPTQKEYENAKESIILYEKALSVNKGVAIIDGKFVGPPIVSKAKSIINKAEQIKAQNKESFVKI